MANTFDKKYEKNINSLAKHNNVDTGTAAAMLRSNLDGKTSYKGGGVLDYRVAGADLKASRAEESRSSGGGGSISTAQDSYADAVKKAYMAKNQALQDGLKNQLEEIKVSSDDNRSSAYVNSRISAIGNNEQLASRGLAGELYGSPMSGKSESSRINENVALGNAINALNRQQSSLENNARATVMAQMADNELQMAQAIAQLRQQERQMEMSEYGSTIGAYSNDYQAEINRLKAMGYSDDDWRIKMLRSARQDKIAGISKAQAEAEQQAFENQLKMMETQYKINKPYYKSSGGRSGGSSGSSSKSKLTYAQAKKLYDDGYTNGDVVSVLEKNTSAKWEGGFDIVDRRLANMGALAPSSKVALVETFFNQGKLTEDEAMFLLQKYGLMR